MQKQNAERAVRLVELRGIIADLSELDLQPSEESELRKEENRLIHVEKLSMLLKQIRFHIQEKDGAVLEQLELARKLLNDAEQIDEECANIHSGVKTALIQLEDSYQELVHYSDKVEADPARLGWVNERLSQIQHFVRKFRLENAEELLILYQNSQQELDSLKHYEENEREILDRIEQLRNQLQERTKMLSEKRHEEAKIMDHAIVDELHQLGMEKACFNTSIVTASFTENKEASTSTGIDQVEFFLAVNPGQEMRSLVKVASGGELSRIMLALKTVLTTLDSVEILIFDEVDKGISGRIAEIVGQKLHSLGKNHQTLCVTHLPQIAAFAEHHFLVSKHSNDNETYTKIKPLKTENERAQAIADLIGGQEITEQTLELAYEMLHNFQVKNCARKNNDDCNEVLNLNHRQ